MPVSWFLAWRFFREGKLQSLLVVAGATVGVTVMVFLSALIDGLQAGLISQTLGTQAHVVVHRPDEVAREVGGAIGHGAVVMARVEPIAQRVRSMVRWQQTARELSQLAEVTAVSPTVSGPAVVMKGAASRAVLLHGVDAVSFAEIYPVAEKMVSGALSLNGAECVIGRELAQELGVGVGDSLRIASVEGDGGRFTVAGVFDLGNREVNRRWVIVSMRSAQTMLGLVGGVTAIELKVRDIFEAERVAETVTARTGLVAESWMTTNERLLVALRSQKQSSRMIQFFVVLAVAMGIASVLVVSVVQKKRELGILRAMGTSRETVLWVFLLQGLLVGVIASVVGGVLGGGLGTVFAETIRNADGTPRFRVEVGGVLLLRSAMVAMVTGVLAAVLPARRAAGLDPAVAMRDG